MSSVCKTLIYDMPVGTVFVYGSSSFLRVNKEQTDYLEREHKVLPSCVGKRDWAGFPAGVINLFEMRSSGYSISGSGTPASLDSLSTAEQTNGRRLISWLQGAKLLGPVNLSQPKVGQTWPAKPELTPEQRFYNDRVRKGKEADLTAQRLVAMAAQETKDVPPPPTKTKGDQCVDQARAGSLKQIDEAVSAIEGSSELLKKVGVDHEVKKAIDDGLKAFAPYRKLRKKGKA